MHLGELKSATLRSVVRNVAQFKSRDLLRNVAEQVFGRLAKNLLRNVSESGEQFWREYFRGYIFPPTPENGGLVVSLCGRWRVYGVGGFFPKE